MRAWADGRRAFRPFVEQTDAPFWRGLSSPRGEKMPIPYARPVIDDKGYGVECPKCGHISRAPHSQMFDEDDVTKGAMSAHGEHWQREHEGR